MTVVVSKLSVEELRAAHAGAPLISAADLDSLRAALEATTAPVMIVEGLVDLARALNRVVPDAPTRFIVAGIDPPRIEPLRALLHAAAINRTIIASWVGRPGSRMDEVIAEILASPTAVPGWPGEPL
ncbi:MAG: hypothetical protein U0228_10180 [Myxococcaceae bacterium]